MSVKGKTRESESALTCSTLDKSMDWEGHLVLPSRAFVHYYECVYEQKWNELLRK
jgi:hypothetical protein